MHVHLAQVHALHLSLTFYWWMGGRFGFTDSEAELQNVDGPLLLQEVHEAEQEVLLLPDLLELQLQDLHAHAQARQCTLLWVVK